MRSFAGLGIVALLAAVILFAVPAGAQNNPLTGKPAPSPASEAAGSKNPLTGKTDSGPAKGSPRVEQQAGLWAAVGRTLIKFQIAANREIGQRMRAIRDGDSSGPLFMGVLLALLYGALHTLGPGHGKFVILSYFVGHDASYRRGFMMGLQIAVFHVLSAIVVVSLADFLLRRAFGLAPSELPVIRQVSYGIIAVIGLYMVWQAVQRVRLARASGAAARDHGGHDACCNHAKGGEVGMLSMAVGAIPCTGAILVLLYALANDILFEGVILVAAISAGMAFTMSLLGVLSILFRRVMTRWFESSGGRGTLSISLNFVGAIAVTLIGVGLFLTAV